jgi:hypothetical protein
LASPREAHLVLFFAADTSVVDDSVGLFEDVVDDIEVMFTRSSTRRIAEEGAAGTRQGSGHPRLGNDFREPVNLVRRRHGSWRTTRQGKHDRQGMSFHAARIACFLMNIR